MPKRRLSLLIPTIIVAVALPEALMLMFYKYKGDPTLLPLGITKASLSTGEPPKGARYITVRIDWGEDAKSPNTRAEVATAIGKAILVYDVDYHIKHRTVPGKHVAVYYMSEVNVFGPYTLSNAATGIPMALAAFRMAEKAK